MQTLPALAKLYCSEEFTQGLDEQIICFSVINTVLAITAVVGNTVVLMALHKETSLHRPSKALLQNLVASDLCVGFAELALAGNWISMLQEQWGICQFFFQAHIMMGIICVAVSLCTLAAISVDRVLALLLGLRYRQVVTVRRVYVVVIVLWILIGVGMAILTMLNTDAGGVVALSAIAVCLLTSTFCYTTIFFTLRNQQTQVHNNSPEQENQTISLNISRYRRTVSTTLWLQMSVVFCYLPYLLFAPVAYRQIVKTQSPSLYSQFYSTVTLMCSNSILNPILYCWKIKEVRRVVKEILRCR
ncbi:PREDICTED: melanocortin receptor 3-like [Acropora digitifera]|uniref:melanocortin receptor 3-like n=1 Tax=Acropora digitifera TaxID=70779 RepID=UPI00077A9326|nr:PREDICTED: melanocortin receptor 3-like [Acropora digitifera]